MLSKLNPEQRQGAASENHCLVIAPPGSGKTGMLATKAAYLLSKGPSVAAVTFTRESAIELKERILALVGVEAMPRLLVGTYHSIDMLMAHPTKSKTAMGRDILAKMNSPFKQPWNIVSTGIRTNYIILAINESEFSIVCPDKTLQKASETIERIKASGPAKDDPDQAIALVEIYQALLKRNKVIDFQDILLETNAALRAGTLTPLDVDYLLLDEFQDTDPVQLEWALHHAKRSKITAVGDDDQSIYGFRNSLGYEGMRQFIDACKPDEIRLQINYRSRPIILEHASNLIRNNNGVPNGNQVVTGRMDKVVLPNKLDGGSVIWDWLPSPLLEADAVSAYAQHAYEKKQSMAVIARTNRRLELIQSYLIKRNIPCKIERGSILDTPEFELYRSFMRQWLKPSKKDNELLLAWIGMESEDIAQVSKKKDFNLLGLTTAQIKTLQISDEGKKCLRSMLVVIDGCNNNAPQGSFSMLFDSITQFLDKHTLDKAALGKQSLSRYIACEKLYMSARMEPFLQPGAKIPFKNTPEVNLQNLKDQITFVENLCKPDEKTEEDSEPYVCHLLSAHGSKGLEFDHVWIIGADEDVFPDVKEGATEQEERRLMFVAMTRAREHLVLTACGSTRPSKFILEANVVRAEKGNPLFSPNNSVYSKPDKKGQSASSIRRESWTQSAVK